jgi:hypothetical protein
MAKLIEPVAAVLFVCCAVAMANYYMDLGWFGSYGRQVLSIVVLVVVIFAGILVRRKSQKRE